MVDNEFEFIDFCCQKKRLKDKGDLALKILRVLSLRNASVALNYLSESSTVYKFFGGGIIYITDI